MPDPSTDSNHDDFFQSWSLDANNVVGNSTGYNVTLRNNPLISRTDPNQPLYNPAQGIDHFDGMSANWVIENNVIFTSIYHGSALYGATNCQILHNTVMPDPLDGASAITPWIYITQHKPGRRHVRPAGVQRHADLDRGRGFRRDDLGRAVGVPGNGRGRKRVP